MRSARVGPDDLTARARIRDSAVRYFGRHGFSSATVRAIATDAGVSPALVLHHFGSKDGLRQACDSYVIECIDELAGHASTHLAPQDLLDLMSRTPQLSPLVPYLITTMTEGGHLAGKLWDRLVDDTMTYLEAAVAGGVVRPTGDERARAELLTVLKVGMYTLARYVMPRSPSSDGVGSIPPPAADLDVAAIAARFTVPTLELLTNGMFTTSDYLDAFAQFHRPPAAPEGSARPEEAAPPKGTSP